MKPPRHKCILIAGPGRCGTTFLWSLFRDLGFDVGKHPEYLRSFVKKTNPPPYVIKGTGGLCINTLEHIERNNLEVEHMFICIRNLHAQVLSLDKMKKDGRLYNHLSDENRKKKIQDETSFAYGQLFSNIFKLDILHTIVEFPLSAESAVYCYDKISWLDNIPVFDRFKDIWENTVDKKKIRFR